MASTNGFITIHGEIVKRLAYKDLLPDTVLLNIDDGKTIRALAL